jgi:hypothetical protein
VGRKERYFCEAYLSLCSVAACAGVRKERGVDLFLFLICGAIGLQSQSTPPGVPTKHLNKEWNFY